MVVMLYKRLSVFIIAANAFSLQLIVLQKHSELSSYDSASDESSSSSDIPVEASDYSVGESQSGKFDSLLLNLIPTLPKDLYIPRLPMTLSIWPCLKLFARLTFFKRSAVNFTCQTRCSTTSSYGRVTVFARQIQQSMSLKLLATSRSLVTVRNQIRLH